MQRHQNNKTYDLEGVRFYAMSKMRKRNQRLCQILRILRWVHDNGVAGTESSTATISATTIPTTADAATDASTAGGLHTSIYTAVSYY